MSEISVNPNQKISIIYDGQCPFCSSYVKLLRIRENLGTVSLINARTSPEEVLLEIKAAGLDLNEGMVVKIDDRMYYGAEAIHVLASVSTKFGMFNRINGFIFRSARLSRFLYPFMRTCRNATLKILGRKKISSL